LEATQSINGIQLKNMFIAGGAWLKSHVAQVNALNVFPVPDGDTGTNMFLTTQAALKQLHTYDGDHAGKVAELASQGALMGARGNSGVIFSQILDGFSTALADKAHFSIPEFAAALHRASEKAYKAVAEPVEGTILTVIKEAARTGKETAGTQTEPGSFLADVLQTAQTTLKLTPELLPILKEAGVVDSGGQGLVYFLEGMWRSIENLPVDADDTPDEIMTAHLEPGSIEEVFTPGYGYDVQFLVHGDFLDIDAIRKAIVSMGECPLVVGNPQTVKVHVHVPDPGVPISYGISQGFLTDIVVENMEEQFREFSHQKEVVTSAEPVSIALVCVSPGPGLSKTFESLGATAIINGGQTMNPSTQEFLNAIEQVPTQQIIVLPNNSNIVLTAQQASSMAVKDVHVVPTKNIPQGIGALLAFNPETDMAANINRMTGSTDYIQTIEITRSVRNTTINGLQVHEGDIIGLLNDRLVSTGKYINEVTLDVLSHVTTDDVEIVTVYYGEEAPSDDVDQLPALLEKIHPHLEVEILDGGQPHYHYIISLE